MKRVGFTVKIGFSAPLNSRPLQIFKPVDDDIRTQLLYPVDIAGASGRSDEGAEVLCELDS